MYIYAECGEESKNDDNIFEMKIKFSTNEWKLRVSKKQIPARQMKEVVYL